MVTVGEIEMGRQVNVGITRERARLGPAEGGQLRDFQNQRDMMREVMGIEFCGVVRGDIGDGDPMRSLQRRAG